MIHKVLQLIKVEDFEETLVIKISMESNNKKGDKKMDKRKSKKFEVGITSSINGDQNFEKKQTKFKP